MIEIKATKTISDISKGKKTQKSLKKVSRTEKIVAGLLFMKIKL